MATTNPLQAASTSLDVLLTDSAVSGTPNGGTPKIARADCPERTSRRTIDLR